MKRLACLILVGMNISGCIYNPDVSVPPPKELSVLKDQVRDSISTVNEELDLQLQYKAQMEAFYTAKRLDFLADRALYIHNLNKQLTCLALNIYHEAKFEPTKGMEAVGIVTLNRLKSHNYPNTICQVVYERGHNVKTHKLVCQFSWTCWNQPKAHGKEWYRALKVAREVYFDHMTIAGFSDVTLYYADYIPPPYWAADCVFVAQIGHQLFYKPQD